MIVREIRIDEKDAFNAKVDHPVQCWEWGEFKKKTGAGIVRLGMFEGSFLKSAYQLSFHRIPKTNFTIGYFPKGPLINEPMLEALTDLSKRQNAVFIKLEPNVYKSEAGGAVKKLSEKFNLVAGKTVFTPFTFQIDLTRSEDELMASMKSKTRYNVRLAQRSGVTIQEDNSTKALEMYLKLTRETSKRQGFYAHSEEYHRQMWEVLHTSMKSANQVPIAHLLTAAWQGKVLTTWIVFVFKDWLYYPYGASSSENRNLMQSNLMMWEAMRFGKNLGCKMFDLWGCLGPNPDSKNPWYGFHRFKEGYGGKLAEFIGTYDLVTNPQLYSLIKLANDVRWKVLRLISKLR